MNDKENLDVQVFFRITETDKRLLDEIAKQEERPVAQILRRAMKAFLRSGPADVPRQTPQSRVGNLLFQLDRETLKEIVLLACCRLNPVGGRSVAEILRSAGMDTDLDSGPERKSTKRRLKPRRSLR